MAQGGKSLQELMGDIASQLDDLPEPKPMDESIGSSIKDSDLPELDNLFNRVLKDLEGPTKGAKGDKNPDKMMGAEGGSDSLESMLRTLNSNIKAGDWLTQNTAEKWVQENPQLAEEYMKAAEKHQKLS